MDSGIYQIFNIKNNKRYIGSSKNIESRLKDHIKSLHSNRHHSILLQRAWNKCEPSSFKFQSIEFCSNNTLLEREQYWMDFFKSYIPENGYNIAPKSGSCLGVKQSDETKKKLRDSWVYEKHFTPETRAKLSKARLGYKFSEESKKKMSERAKGRKLSEETIQKMILNLKGIAPWNKGKKLGPQSSELVEKRIAPLRGKVRSEEVKRKISNSRKGIIFSDDTKKKMSLSHLGVPMPEAKRIKIGNSLRGRSKIQEHTQKAQNAKKVARFKRKIASFYNFL